MVKYLRSYLTEGPSLFCGTAKGIRWGGGFQHVMRKKKIVCLFLIMSIGTITNKTRLKSKEA